MGNSFHCVCASDAAADYELKSPPSDSPRKRFSVVLYRAFRAIYFSFVSLACRFSSASVSANRRANSHRKTGISLGVLRPTYQPRAKVCSSGLCMRAHANLTPSARNAITSTWRRSRMLFWVKRLKMSTLDQATDPPLHPATRRHSGHLSCSADGKPGQCAAGLQPNSLVSIRLRNLDGPD